MNLAVFSQAQETLWLLLFREVWYTPLTLAFPSLAPFSRAGGTPPAVYCFCGVLILFAPGCSHYWPFAVGRESRPVCLTTRLRHCLPLACPSLVLISLARGTPRLLTVYYFTVGV